MAWNDSRGDPSAKPPVLDGTTARTHPPASIPGSIGSGQALKTAALPLKHPELERQSDTAPS